MTMLTEAQRLWLTANAVARREGQHVDPYPVVRLYTLDAGCVWLLTELAADGDLAYGLCDVGIGLPSLGEVRLSALEAMRGPCGMRVVVDPHFLPRRPLSAYAVEAWLDGTISG